MTDADHPDHTSTRTIVHVLRHGEVHNPRGILYGRLPGFRLSVAGEAQARAVASVLADHDITHVVASPLQRAQETATPIAEAHKLDIVTDENLIEAGNEFEGLKVAVGDGALSRPRHWWKLRDPFTPSWGEPYLQIAHRMQPSMPHASRQSDTKPSSSAISFRSGLCVDSCRVSVCGTIPVTVSVDWRR